MKISTVSFLFLALIGNVDANLRQPVDVDVTDEAQMAKMKETLYESKKKLDFHNSGRAILSDAVGNEFDINVTFHTSAYTQIMQISYIPLEFS